METKGWKSFWTALWVSLLVLLPLVAGTAVLAQRQAAGRVRASESQSGGAGAAAPGGKPPDPAGLRGRGRPGLCPALPERRPELHPSAGGAGPAGRPLQRRGGFSADCYAAAGPARCLQGLRAVLDLPEDAHYLAATPETLAGLCDGYGSLRVGFSGALSPEELARFEQAGVGDWDGVSAHAFLEELAASLPPASTAAARAAVWDAFFRQNLDALPASLPDALRSASDSLLTGLTAADLLTLEDTLELLANGQAAVTSGVLPGRWDRAGGLYTLDEEADAAVQAFFNVSDSAAASGAQSASSSAPYPSTSVPGGQADGPSM